LVLHAWWGLNDTIKAFCSRLAENGFTAYAPDLYRGNTADTIAGAEALANGLDHDQAKADVAEALAFLNQHAASPQMGFAVVGFSLGAMFAIDISTASPDRIHSVVLYYGIGPGEFARAKATYLGHFAGQDKYEPQENVDWLKNALESAGRPVKFYTYPGAGHWFCEPDRSDAFDPTSAESAWERTLAFLQRSPAHQTNL
jgi:carboxymethylenebutenolidase